MGVTLEKGCSPAMDMLGSGGQIAKMRTAAKILMNGALLPLLSKQIVCTSGQTPSMLGLKG